MDNKSEAASEKKRGRPRAFPDGLLAHYRGLFPDVRSGRHRQDLVYRGRAMHVLGDDPEVYWLYNQPAVEAGQVSANSVAGFRTCILAALGRIEDEADLRAVARQVCAVKPGTKEAVALIRRWRTGKAPPARALGLAAAIEGAIHRYARSHPDITPAVVRRALEILGEEDEGEDG
jgi:hypothetical protein